MEKDNNSETSAAVAVGADGALYISNCDTCGGVGRVIRVVLAQDG